MMGNPAIYSRVLQFKAGPNETEFHACVEHKKYLEDDLPSLFFAHPDDKIQDVRIDDEMDCHFCQEP